MKHLKLDKNEKLICTEFVSLCAEKTSKKPVKKLSKNYQKCTNCGLYCIGRSTTFGAEKLEKVGILSFYRTIVRWYD